MQDNKPLITGIIESGPQFRTTGASIDEKYVRLNSGKLQPRYKDFIAGTDNDTRLSNEQSKMERIGHGLLKLGGRTLTTMAGTFGSLLPGDEINEWLDDMNTHMELYLPNYKDAKEREMGFWKALGTLNIDFLADEVGQGVSMVTGIVASDALIAAATGGASLASSIPKRLGQLGKLGRTSDKTSKALKGAKTINMSGVAKEILKSDVDPRTLEKIYNSHLKLAKVDKLIAGARPFLYTHYEADLEAFHTQKEIVDGYLEQIRNGEIPKEEQDLLGVMGEAENASKFVYWGNVPLVGISNFVVLGGLLGWRGAAKGASKLALDETKTAFKVAKHYTKPQRALRKAWSLWKPMMTEGLIEEGGQGMMSEAAIAYVNAMYNPATNREAIDILQAIKEGFHESYFTKEGFMEVGVGMLIGSIGHQGGLVRQYKGGAKNFFATEFGLEQRFLQESADALTAQLGTVREHMMSGGQMRLVERFNDFNSILTNTRRSTEASEKGLTAQASMYNSVAQFNFHQMMRNMGMEDAMIDTLNAQIDDISTEDFKESGISEDSIPAFKEVLKTEITNQFNRNKYALDVVEAIRPERQLNKKDREHLAKAGLGDKDIRNIMALEISVGINSMENIQTTLKELQELTGIEHLGEALRIQANALSDRSQNYQRAKKLKSRREELLERQKVLTQVTTNMEVREETIDAETLRREAEKVAPELQQVVDELLEVEAELEKLANIEATVTQRDAAIWRDFPPYSSDYSNLFDFADDGLLPAEALDRAQEAMDTLEELVSNLRREYESGKLSQAERATIRNTITSIENALSDYTYNTSTLKTMVENFALRNSPEYAYDSYKKTVADRISKGLEIKEEVFVDPAMRSSYISLEDYIEANKADLTEADKYKLRATHRIIQSVTRDTHLQGARTIVDPISETAYAEYLQTGNYEPFLEEIIQLTIDGNPLSDRQRQIYAEHKDAIDKEIKLERARRGDSMENIPRPEDIEMDTRLSFKERLLDFVNRLKQTDTTFRRILPDDLDTDSIPTEEDYIRYEEILNKELSLLNDIEAAQDDPELSPELINLENELDALREEKAALKEKLDIWGTVTGVSSVTGLSISDLLEIALAIQDSRPSPFDTSVLIQLDELTSEIEWNTRKDERYYEIGQVYDNSVVSKTSNASGQPAITVHNISLATFLSQLGGVTQVSTDRGKTQLNSEEEIREAVKNGKTDFGIIYENAEGKSEFLDIEIDKLGNIQFDESYVKNSGIGNFLIKPIASYTRNYQPLLVRQTDGTIRIVKSDFSFNRGTKTTNPKAVNRVKVGDALNLIVPLHDEYNANLLNKVREAKTEKQRVEAVEALNNSMIIFLVDSNGELVQVLKGTSTYTGATATDVGARLRALRTQMAGEVLAYLGENSTAEEYNTGKAVEVKQVFRGFPNIEVVENESGEYEALYEGISAQAAKTVVDIGYMEDGRIKLRNGSRDVISHPYMTPYTKTDKYKGKKIPFVVTEQDGTLIAYPVKLKSETIDITDIFEEAINKSNPVEQAIAINNLIVESGLPINEYGVTSITVLEEGTLEALREVFSELTMLPEVDSWLSEETDFNGVLENDILINVDLADNPFSASKLHVDLSKLVPPTPPSSPKNTTQSAVNELIGRLELSGELEIICD